MQHFKLYLFIKSKKMHYWLLHINMIQWKWKKSLFGFMFSLNLADGTKARRSRTILIDCASGYFRMPFINIGQWFPRQHSPSRQPASPLPVFSLRPDVFSLSLHGEQRDRARFEIWWSSVCKAALLFSPRWYTWEKESLRFCQLPNRTTQPFFFFFFFLS